MCLQKHIAEVVFPAFNRFMADNDAWRELAAICLLANVILPSSSSPCPSKFLYSAGKLKLPNCLCLAFHNISSFL